MPQMTIAKALKLLLLCFVVGFLLTKLGISPAEFWRDMVNLAKYAFNNAKSLIHWSAIYILAGAAVVVPIYAIVLLRRYFSGKS